MADTIALNVKAIAADLFIDGDTQRISFRALHAIPIWDQHSFYQPVTNSPSIVRSRITNYLNQGFGTSVLTSVNDINPVYCFNAISTTINGAQTSTNYTNLLTYNETQSDEFTFYKNLNAPDPIKATHLVTKSFAESTYVRKSDIASLSLTSSQISDYVSVTNSLISIALTSKTWTASQITDFDTKVTNYNFATRSYVDSQMGSLNSNDFNIHTLSGNQNWLRKNGITKSNVQIYGLTTTSFMIENLNPESAGIGFDGSTDACTIWTAGDFGSYLNIQDEDIGNSRLAYVASTGAWTTVSSKERKHSIKNKTNNNVLERFLELSVKTYGYKYDNKTENADRIKYKSNKMATGFILEELFEIFPNCIPDYYNELNKKKDVIKKPDITTEIKDTLNCGIDYNTLLCYFVMAFQEFVQKTNYEITGLKEKLNN